MLKFLRLYQGWILAIFGTFLVITFLLPQAIQGLFQNAATTGGDAGLHRRSHGRRFTPCSENIRGNHHADHF